MLPALLFTIPWVALGLYVAAFVRLPRSLPTVPAEMVRWPHVTVVIPARNEAQNIEGCLASITATRYPSFDVVVVDDRSEDGTGDLARTVSAGMAKSVTVLAGQPLPAGWFGKPWACQQGADIASGDLLLFTDADTIHAPDLLGRTVTALEEDGAEALTVIGRQLMVTFWERLVQPQIFFMILLTYPNGRAPFRRDRWRKTIANGQYMLFRRTAYDRIEGHGSVKNEVVEDLRLAQVLTRAGHHLTLREASDGLSTRMYRSLGELVAGWSKNMATAARQIMGPLLGDPAILGGIASHVILWLAPPVALLAALTGLLGAEVLLWAGVTVTLSVGYWMYVSTRMESPARFGLLYPLGSAVVVYIIVRSWIRGRRIQWKGREYGSGSAR